MALADDISRMWDMAQLATPMALRVAATLRLADHLARQTYTAPELAGVIAVSSDALDPVLRHLAFRGVLSSDADGRYALTTLGETLRADHPGGMHALLDTNSAIGRGDLAYVQLLHCVRTGEPGYPVQYGRTFWDDLATDPALAESFYDQMSAQVADTGPAIIAGYDWAALGHIVDVGGGDGSLLVTLLDRYRSLHGTIVELKEQATAAEDAVTRAGLSDRAEVVTGSFFDPLPPFACGYLLHQIIHDWDDDRARVILRRCAEAAGAGGRVLLIERTGIDGGSMHASMDVRMLVYFGGKERTTAQYVDLATDAGLRLASVHDAGPFSIMEFVIGQREDDDQIIASLETLGCGIDTAASEGSGKRSSG